MSGTHVIIGSSPSVVMCFHRVCRRYRDGTFWTCNGGYALFVAAGLRPHRYMCSDQRSKDLFRCYREDWAKRGKELTHPPGDINVRLSGMVMIHLAIEEGADRIVLAGLDGYGHEPCYFDARAAGVGPLYAMDQFVPWINRTAASHPGIEFILYGVPTYDVAAPNWSVHGIPPNARTEYQRLVRSLDREATEATSCP